MRGVHIVFMTIAILGMAYFTGWALRDGRYSSAAFSALTVVLLVVYLVRFIQRIKD